MSYNSDTVIIGAGLMGSSIAFQLARRGVKTTVIERNERPGLETTARSGAIIRAHYGVPELVVLANAANERFLRFPDEVGSGCGFTKSGYMVIVDDADTQTLKSNIAMQKDLGVDVSLIDRSQVAELVPNLIVDDIALAAYEQNGGYASPSKTVSSYAGRASELGAKFLFGSPVVGADRNGSGWSISIGSGEVINSEHVVIATGNWSCPVGSFFGLDLPVAPVRAQIVVVDRPGKNQSMPVVSDLINLAYFREEGDAGMWVGSSDMADLQEKLQIPDHFNEVADEGPISSALTKTALRFRSNGNRYDGTVQRSFTGLYETTPDWQPIIDNLPDNVHVAVGFSGHGFKLAPVIGDIIADSVIGTPSQFDTSIFQLDRFAANRPIKSQYTYQRARFLR